MSSFKNVIEGNNSNNNLVGNNTQTWQIVDGQYVLLPADDAIYGRGGNDTLSGRGGDDDLFGGTENDYLSGGNGNDRLYGENGNDNLLGGEGNDFLYGEHGNDSHDGGSGNDTIFGGIGNDGLIGSSGNDFLAGGIVTNGLSGFDTVSGGSGADIFTLQSNSFMHYLGSGFATITDFSSAEGDRIWLGDYGADNDNFYSLGTGNWGGTAAQDTAIYYQGDLIARVYDSAIDLNLDVDYIRYVAA